MLPHEETITEYIHDQSINYNSTGHVTLLFDGKDPVKFNLAPDGNAVSCPLNPPRKAKQITVQLGGYQFDPGKAHNIGMDNIWIKVQRAPEFAIALDQHQALRVAVCALAQFDHILHLGIGRAADGGRGGNHGADHKNGI
jgi:hypothetical protein